MKLTFLPIRCDDRLVLHRAGDVLTINGEPFDFRPLAEGATLPRDAIESPWFAGPVERIDGVLQVTLLLPHGPKASEATRYPDPVEAATDGPIPIPDWSQPQEDNHAED